MKLIILFLISFTAMAQTKVSIIPNDSKLASMSFEKDNLVDAKKHLKKIVSKSQWLKGGYQEDATDTIFQRESMDITSGEPKIEYFMPTNFSILVEDVTTARAEAKALEDADKAERAFIRTMDLKHDGTVAEWRQKIIRAIRQLRKDSRK